jgi:L-amino acid N-acyltransferase YncA
MSLIFRPATHGDADAITEIYNQRIAERGATFETEPRAVDENLTPSRSTAAVGRITH